MRKKIKYHTFKGRRYVVLDEHYDGYAEVPGREPPGIYVDSDMKGKFKHLETVIHEGMHAAEPPLGEVAVTRVAHDVARWVWRWGYRLEE